MQTVCLGAIEHDIPFCKPIDKVDALIFGLRPKYKNYSHLFVWPERCFPKWFLTTW